MSRPCFCDGTNDSCRFCGGTGILPDDLDSLSGHSHYEFASKDEGNTGGRLPEEHSGFLPAELVLGRRRHSAGRKNRKSRSIAVEQSRLTTSPSPSPLATKKPTTLPKLSPLQNGEDFLTSIGECPNCGLKYRKDVLKSHISKCQKKNPTRLSLSSQHKRNTHEIPETQEATAPIPMTSFRTGLKCEPCPFCKAMVRSDRLSKHIVKVHDRRRKRRKSNSQEPYTVSGGLPSLGKRR